MYFQGSQGYNLDALKHLPEKMPAATSTTVFRILSEEKKWKYLEYLQHLGFRQVRG